MPDGKVCPEQFRGWLLKWTNYIKGYQKRWFVLSNGLLSYYRTQEEMAHSCRGTINVAGAFIDTIDSINFVITNGPSQVYHLRALNEVERQRWVTALELAKQKAVKNLDSENSDVESVGGEEGGAGGGTDSPLLGLQTKLKELNTSHDVAAKNSQQLIKLIAEVEEAGEGGSVPLAKLKENLSQFKVTAAAMNKTAEEFVLLAENTDRRWTRALQYEHSIRVQLQENMEKLATEMHGLETQARRSFHEEKKDPLPLAQGPVEEKGLENSAEGEVNAESGKEESDDEKFFDAVEDESASFDKSVTFEPPMEAVGNGGEKEEEGDSEVKFSHKRNLSVVSMNDAQLLTSSPEPDQLPVCLERTMSLPRGPVPSFFEKWEPTIAKRRSTIPPKPSHRLNLWSIMKNCIGRDLSKIPMPVNFNEPISILQRMVEDMSHIDVLEKAAACDTSLEELAYLAVYSVACYGSAAISSRVGKPFNPLLGETYECDRRAEHGWRAFLEQVTHHPPMFAKHVEHKDFTLWEEYTMASKFRGKYLVCYPIGNTHIVFHRSGNHYTWNKVVTTIHNIIIGRLWIDQSGEAKITNHTIGGEANIKFYAYSYFSRERQRRISGSVCDGSGKAHYMVKGYWDTTVHISKVLEGEGKNAVLSDPQIAWENPSPQSGHELIYSFSEFTCTLNELEEGMAPTDSRLRPDQRLMENGDFEEANIVKLRLEEKQRAKRRKREATAAKAAEASAAGHPEDAARLEKEASYSPLWFKKEYDPLTNTMMHVYKGGYWEKKLSGHWDVEFPDIF